MQNLRISLVGFGVVSQGLAELLLKKQAQIRQDYGINLVVVSVATRRAGFLYQPNGLDLSRLLQLAQAGQSLESYPDCQRRDSTLVGLKAGETDVLVEVTGTNLRDAEPGLSHIRAALEQSIPVVTANKGPAALAASELFALSERNKAPLLLEATVMAGTPVLNMIREGLAGSEIQAVRGILNGTTNYILSAMMSGRSYQETLAEAQAAGYAEADPTADVEGFDALAKVLILAATVFKHPLKLADVPRTGISGLSTAQIQQANDEGKSYKLIASLRRTTQNGLEARVEPVALPLSDPLARVDGVLNAISVQTDTPQEVTIIGPGAGGLQTAQGLLADLLTLAKSSQHEDNTQGQKERGTDQNWQTRSVPP